MVNKTCNTYKLVIVKLPVGDPRMVEGWTKLHLNLAYLEGGSVTVGGRAYEVTACTGVPIGNFLFVFSSIPA